MEVLIVSIEEKLLNDFQTLPQDKKIEVLDFIDFLKSKNENKLENTMDSIINENHEALKELSKQ
jgi:hypothetical protein